MEFEKSVSLGIHFSHFTFVFINFLAAVCVPKLYGHKFQVQVLSTI